MNRLQEVSSFLNIYLYSFYLLVVQLFFSAKSKGPRRTPDALYGTTVILSGANSGIGQSLCRIFQLHDACVISLVKPKQTSPSNLYIEADLFHLDSLPSVVEDIRALLNAIPKNARRKVILLNAAGTLNPSDIYAVNLHAPSILAYLLADSLHAVVFLGSAVAKCATLHRNSFPLLVPSQILRDRYPASKLLLHSVCEGFSRNASLRAIVVHPGIVSTNLYRSEPGIVGVILRSLIPFLAWNPEMSAFRILDILQQAKVFNHAPQFGADYWDARSMRMCTPPVLALERKSPMGKLIVDQVWEELRELVDLINKFNKKGEKKEEEETVVEEIDGNVKEEANNMDGMKNLVTVQEMSGATLLKEE